VEAKEQAPSQSWAQGAGQGQVQWWKWLAPVTLAGAGVVMWLMQLGVSGELRWLLTSYLHSRYTPAEPPPLVFRSPQPRPVDLGQIESPPEWATERLLDRLPPIRPATPSTE